MKKLFLAYFLKRAEITSRYGKIFGISRIISFTNKSSVGTVWIRAPASPRCSMFYSPLCPHVTSGQCPIWWPAPHVTTRSQVQLGINNNSQSQSWNESREASRGREGISLCLMSLICMQCCCHHWSLPLSRADISMGGSSLVTGSHAHTRMWRCDAQERRTCKKKHDKNQNYKQI